jgi:hypothetical protein
MLFEERKKREAFEQESKEEMKKMQLLNQQTTKDMGNLLKEMKEMERELKGQVEKLMNELKTKEVKQESFNSNLEKMQKHLKGIDERYVAEIVQLKDENSRVQKVTEGLIGEIRDIKTALANEKEQHNSLMLQFQSMKVNDISDRIKSEKKDEVHHEEDLTDIQKNWMAQMEKRIRESLSNQNIDNTRVEEIYSQIEFLDQKIEMLLQTSSRQTIVTSSHNCKVCEAKQKSQILYSLFEHKVTSQSSRQASTLVSLLLILLSAFVFFMMPFFAKVLLGRSNPVF